MRKAVVVIPTYNEAKNIGELVDKIFSEVKLSPAWQLELLIVDSYSPDGTGNEIRGLQKKYLHHIHLLETGREGLGKAYLTGFSYAVEKLNAYLILEMDADLQHDPKKINEFVHEIEKGADFVIGARYIKGGSIPANWGLYRKFLSVVGNLVVRFGFMKLKIADWTSGYRAIKTWVIKAILPSVKNYSGYVFQVAVLDNAIKNKAVIREVPLNFKDRTRGVSKINSFQYVSQTLFYVFTHSSFIKFVIVGFIGFFIDFGISFLLIEKIKTAVWLATLTSTESAIISNFLFNNFWSFKHKSIKTGRFSFILGFLKFNLVSAGSVLIQTLGLPLFSNLFGQQYWYIYKVLIIAFVIIPYSYFLYNKVIWKEK